MPGPNKVTRKYLTETRQTAHPPCGVSSVLHLEYLRMTFGERSTLLGTSVNRRRGEPRSVSSRPFPLLLGHPTIRGPYAVAAGLMFWLRRKRLSGS
jgi:hypothetical protein